MRLVLAVCLAGLAVPAAAFSPLTEEEAGILQIGLRNTADQFVLPAYEAQAAAADELHAALTDHCAGAAPRTPAEESFVALFLAWQRASIVGLGPVMDAEGPMRVQLWPDPKGFSARAIRGALREADPALLREGGLEGRSIALTNLTALEHLLYGDLVAGTYGCDLAVAIAAFQADLAQNLVAAWRPGAPFRMSFDTAYAGNATFPDVDSALRAFLAGAVVYTDRLRKFRLDRGLGADPGAARPERTEAVASGAGLASIAVSFRTLAELYDVPYGVFDAAPDMGGTMDYFVLAQTARSISESLALEPRPLVEIAEEDGAGAAELRRLSGEVLFHERFLKTGFLDALGLVAGFTAADGD
ncbi:MAG: imelysin family protein [Pseudomonadota bacterium]